MPNWLARLGRWLLELVVSMVVDYGKRQQEAESRAVVKQEIKDAQETRARVEAEFDAASPDDKQRLRNKWIAAGHNKQ